jgi:glycosyltransferase involved in cell wall biosynthesis
MKILMLFPYAPQPPPLDLAGTKRNLPFLLELAKCNEVSVLSYGNEEQRDRFVRAYGTKLHDVRFVDAKRPRLLNAIERLWLLCTGRSSFRQIHRPAMQAAIDEMTDAHKFDLIHCCVPFFGYFRFPKGVPVTTDTHEVKYDLFRRTAQQTPNPFLKVLYYLSYRFGREEEIQLCKKFALMVTTTERDRDVFRRDLPNQPMVVVQNGAGYNFFEEVSVAAEPDTMTFTGLFTHLPNSEGILHFLKEIFPLVLKEIPSAKVYVVGKDPTPGILARAAKNVVVTGFVDDVRPYMARSQVFIIPLLAGGGIRGKALEAMAMKRPIVTTTIGVEGIHLSHEESALFADTPDQFAQAVIRMLRDPSLRKRLAERAHTIARERYDWAAKGRELDAALRAAAEPESMTSHETRIA